MWLPTDKCKKGRSTEKINAGVFRQLLMVKMAMAIDPNLITSGESHRASYVAKASVGLEDDKDWGN